MLRHLWCVRVCTCVYVRLCSAQPVLGVLLCWRGAATSTTFYCRLLLHSPTFLRPSPNFCHHQLTLPFFFLQVVIDQNVLIKASAELTMTEASSIADNTLEYTVRSLLWALRAPEILKANNGEAVRGAGRGWGGE